jgi:hypothetical protein
LDFFLGNSEESQHLEFGGTQGSEATYTATSKFPLMVITLGKHGDWEILSGYLL